MLLSLCLILVLETPWTTFDIVTYRPIGPGDSFIMLPDGGFVVLDMDDITITKYDAEGHIQKVLARKGRGPDEVLGVFQISLVKNTIVAPSGGIIYLIDLGNGEIDQFITYKTKMKGILNRIPGGWLTIEADLGSDPPDEYLHWYDEEQKLVRTLYEEPLPDNWDRGRFASHKPERVVAWDSTYLEIMPGGDLAVYRHAADAEIQLIDTATGEVRHKIQVNPKPIPMDEAWARARIHQLQSRSNSKKYDYIIPDTFPLIRSISIIADRTIVVSQKAKNELGFETQFFDDRGKPKEVGMWFGDFFRILGIHGDWYYVGTHDEAEDLYGIAKVHKKDFQAFLKANPHSMDKYRKPPL